MSDGLWVWGIDLSTRALDLVVVDEHGHWLDSGADFAANKAAAVLRGPERLAHILERTELFTAAMARHFPPLAVFVELPTGRHPSPALTMACGAVLTGLWHSLVAAFDFPVSIHTVAVSEWKKAVVGHGNASKELVLAHARTAGYRGERQDAADALCVAAYGCRLLDRPRPSCVRHRPAQEAA